jgi:hypothetical protein
MAREQPRMASTSLYTARALTCEYATWRDQPRLVPMADWGLENHCGGNVTVGSNPTPSAYDLGKQP